jgi:hypothetical protein
MKELVGGLVEEARRAPFTVVAVLGLWAYTLLYVIPSVIEARAAANTVQTIQEQLAAVTEHLTAIEIRLAKDHLVDLEGQIDDAKRDEDKYTERTGEDPPAVLSERLYRLQSERSIAQQELDALLSAATRQRQRWLDTVRPRGSQ